MTGEYLIRFAQAHETFRRPELEALTKYEQTNLTIVDYQESSPYCILRLERSRSSPSNVEPSSQCSLRSQDDVAASFISRSILSKAIFELWGSGSDYESLHADVKSRTQHMWSLYQTCSFKFSFDGFYRTRSMAERRDIIESFSYLRFKGQIKMKNPEMEFMIMEEWDEDRGSLGLQDGQNDEQSLEGPSRAPKRIFLGRMVGLSRRGLIDKHDLKKRPYISTTSMDAELALVTATLALAAPNKLFMDPMVGTGGFMVAASELGALTFGSDIDGRSFRGKGAGPNRGVRMNFKKYHLDSLFGDCIASDLTNTPFRIPLSGPLRGSGSDRHNNGRWLDGIISDPPYGVREGLKVLGWRNNRTGPTAPVATPAAAPASIDTKTTPTTTTTTDDHLPNLTAATNTNTNSFIDNPEKSTLSESPTPSSQTLAAHVINGIPAYKLPGYIPPKKPYSFNAMLNDILDFAAHTLVDGGRLAFWMPTANEVSEVNAVTAKDKNTTTTTTTTTILNSNVTNENEGKPSIERISAHDEQQQQNQRQPQQHLLQEQDQKQEKLIVPKEDEGDKQEEETTSIPTHPNLDLKHVCTQSFNKWSRRLLVYERRPGESISISSSIGRSGHGKTNAEVAAFAEDAEYAASAGVVEPAGAVGRGGTNIGSRADDLNPFRRMYFQGFQR